jgi:hypothetical protein
MANQATNPVWVTVHWAKPNAMAELKDITNTSTALAAVVAVTTDGILVNYGQQATWKDYCAFENSLQNPANIQTLADEFKLGTSILRTLLQVDYGIPSVHYSSAPPCSFGMQQTTPGLVVPLVRVEANIFTASLQVLAPAQLLCLRQLENIHPALRQYSLIAHTRSDALAQYAPTNMDEYFRFRLALAHAPWEAITATSWGFCKIPGKYFYDTGARHVFDFLNAMYAGDVAQCKLLLRFLASRGILQALRQHNWQVYAQQMNASWWYPHLDKTSLQARIEQYHSVQVSLL